MYLSYSLDRTRGGLTIIVSEKGGVNIEEVDDKKIRSFLVPLSKEIDQNVLLEIIDFLHLTTDQKKE